MCKEQGVLMRPKTYAEFFVVLTKSVTLSCCLGWSLCSLPWRFPRVTQHRARDIVSRDWKDLQFLHILSWPAGQLALSSSGICQGASVHIVLVLCVQHHEPPLLLSVEHVTGSVTGTLRVVLNPSQHPVLEVLFIDKESGTWRKVTLPKVI